MNIKKTFASIFTSKTKYIPNQTKTICPNYACFLEFIFKQEENGCFPKCEVSIALLTYCKWYFVLSLNIGY